MKPWHFHSVNLKKLLPRTKYEDEIEDDYIVGEVIITAEDTVDDLRERVEEELEMEDGFLMMLNDHDLLSTTSTHKVYKYLEADNILVLKY